MGPNTLHLAPNNLHEVSPRSFDIGGKRFGTWKLVLDTYVDT